MKNLSSRAVYAGFGMLAVGVLLVANAQAVSQCISTYCDYEKDNATLRDDCHTWYEAAYHFAMQNCLGQLPSFENWILSGPCAELPVNSTEREFCYFAAPNAASEAMGYKKGQDSVHKGYSGADIAGSFFGGLFTGALMTAGAVWSKLRGCKNSNADVHEPYQSL